MEDTGGDINVDVVVIMAIIFIIFSQSDKHQFYIYFSRSISSPVWVFYFLSLLPFDIEHPLISLFAKRTSNEVHEELIIHLDWKCGAFAFQYTKFGD